jgi:hypothetical protein
MMIEARQCQSSARRRMAQLIIFNAGNQLGVPAVASAGANENKQE